MNNVLVTVEVVVDIDRKSHRYSSLAVDFLDPNKRGLKTGDPTASEIDRLISSQMAIEAVKALLTLPLHEAIFGDSTLRIQSPKTIKEVLSQNEGE